MKTNNYTKFHKDFTKFCPVKINEPMKLHTSFKVGGPADIFAQPLSVKNLTQVVSRAKDSEIPVTILGSGTNILVKDNGIRGIVISLSKMKSIVKIKKKNAEFSIITVSAGTSLAHVCRSAMENSLGGLSFAAGIPGTIGGAVKMNAGTGQGCIADVIHSVDILEKEKSLRSIERSALTFSHRKLKFDSSVKNPDTAVILRTSFLLENENPASLDIKWKTLLNKRKKTQPQGIPCAGCFFKNPDGTLPAGALIDKAGLKKTRIGDAAVSDKHANFILNLGSASAKEIILLSDMIKEAVFKHFNVNLTEEVKIKGE